MFGRFLMIVLAAVLLWAILARASSGSGKETLYVVKRYDTLWSIADRKYGGDPRDAVWRIRERNHLGTTLLVPGQRLVLPP
jgi:nucleoid-associated protein YgaU